MPRTAFPVAVDVGIEGSPGGDATLVIAARGIAGARVEEHASLEEAERPRPFLDILGPLLAESGGSAFVVAGVTLANATTVADRPHFHSPVAAEAGEERFYARLDEAFRTSAADRAERIGRGPEAPARPVLGPAELAAFADRASISPRGREPLPFARLEADGSIDAGHLASCAGFTVVPLPPIMFDTRPWVTALERLAAALPGARLAVGLANLSHLAIAQQIAPLGSVQFFADVHLYTANRWTAAFLSERVPRLLFAYRWIEDERTDAGWQSIAAVPVVTVAPGFRAPLFASRGCFAKHVLNQGACPAGCPRDFRVDLRQGGRRFQVVVEDCVTYLFA